MRRLRLEAPMFSIEFQIVLANLFFIQTFTLEFENVMGKSTVIVVGSFKF